MKFQIFKGQTLIELILAMGLAAIIFPALLGGFMSSREGRPQQEQRLQAIALLKQTEKAVKSVRDNDWTAFAINGTYHTEVSNNKWTLTSGSQTANNLTQQVDISDISRDTNGAIVSSGGTVDPSTKKVVITISWTQPQNSQISSTMYLTRTTNLTYTESTYDEFNAGIKSDAVIAYTSGSSTDGQVQLGAGGGGGDWCSPSFSITSVDLPKSGVANAITAIAGPNNNESTVFAGTGENASGISFAKIDLPGNPPVVPTPYPTFDGYKTNAVFGESNYAYLTTDNNSKEIVAIDLNNIISLKYQEAGYIDLPGNVNGSSIYVTSDNKAYITSSDKKFYIYEFNANRSLATLKGSLTLDGVGKKVLTVGNYAYVATDSTTYPLEIIDVSTPTAPVFAGNFGNSGKLALGTSQSGVDVYVNTASSTVDRAYLATSLSSTQKEFYIVNVSDKANPKLTNDSDVQLGRYETNGMTPTGVTVVTGNRAIIVGSGGTYQYQVIELSPETGTLSECGPNAHLTYSTGIRGVASVLQSAGNAYSYVITGDASSELKVILGGAGGTYTSSGNFTSAIYDANFSTAFNRFTASVDQPSQTSLRMQVAVAAPSGGSCNNANYTYVGPNGDSSAYFTPSGSFISGIIPFGSYSPSYQNPEQCFRYKTWFSSSDINQTPVLYDMTVNYSP